MNEHPILFSAPMVLAILAGNKTQTRRIAKLNHAARVKAIGSPKNWHPDDPNASLACPYGKPGSKLWVKETHRCFDQVWAADAMECAIQYRADMAAFSEASGKRIDNPTVPVGEHWRPSIFCTRLASRITLEIVSVRVERLQEITKADAIKEGIERIQVPPHEAWKNYQFETAHPRRGVAISDKKHRLLGYESPCASYASLWESINGAESWDANPWVWCLTFRRVAQ